MEQITMYRVMWVNDWGDGEMNQDSFTTQEEAEEYCKDLSESFKEYEYYVEEYRYTPPRQYVNGISGGVDGWEDMYPDYESESGDYGWN